MPGYLPAAQVMFFPKNGGAPQKIYRPYQSFPLDELKKHAEKNEHGALLELGERYYSGWGGAEQNFETAYAYLKQAAELGVQDAQFLLGTYYADERIPTVANDAAKCEELWVLAAENGSWRAMEALAQSYRSGENGLTVDHEKAYAWAEQAERMIRIYWRFYAQSNFVDFKPVQEQILHAHTRITLTLSAYCANGVGVQRDLTAAASWLDRGEKFVCDITGLAKVPVFQERRADLAARLKKDAARADKAAKDEAKKAKK